MDTRKVLSGMVIDSMKDLEEFVKVFNLWLRLAPGVEMDHQEWPLALVVGDRGWWLTYFGHDVVVDWEVSTGADLLAALAEVENKVLAFLGK